MAISIEAVMRRVKNFFTRRGEQPYSGEISITGNVLTPAPSALWVAIRGSLYHDGVYQCVNGYLQGVPEGRPDETFVGVVWQLYPPDDFLALCEEINSYDQKNPVGAYQSESFGDYSYTRGTGSGGVMTWEQAYASALAPYRRMFTEVG